ncbi:MAG: fibronectin type III domain-containing protein, partial [Bacillota bacterium]
VYLSASQGLTLGSQSSSSGGTGTISAVGKSSTGGAIQLPGAVTPPKLPGTTPASPSKVLQLGDQTVSTEEFVSSIQESTNVTEEVRQTLRQRNVLGSDQSDAAVEQAVSSYQAQVAPPAANKVISGREAFISRLQAALETPNKPTLAAPVMNALPTALNRSELSQISAPRLAPTAPSGQTTTQAPPPDDSVSRMLTARRDLLTTTNLNFSSAVAAGLGFIDTLPKLNAWQRDIQYLIIPNRELASYTIKANKPSPQIEVQVGQPMALSSPANLEGYGLDGRVALRWDDPDDLLSRSIVSGFSVERKLASETSFRTVNPNNPVVRMYSRDGQGNLFEAETLYTDTLANGLSATYQIRALDIFGRLSEPSTPIAISVLKTTPPPTPGLEQPELMTIERKPIDLAALKTSAPSIEFGAPNGLAGGLNKPALIDPDTKRREEELERDQQLLEARKQAIRDRHPGQPGIMLHFDHSFEEKVPASKSSASTAQPLVSEPHYTLPEGLERQLAEGLSEYHIYRSEALGKGAFSTPTLIATVSLATLSGAYGSVQDLDSGLLYYDPSIKPGYYYAYWVTAQDSWGNESPFQSKPQVIGYPTTAKPGSPQGLENQFEVNPDLIAEQPKIAGFSERLKIKLPAPATLPGGTTTPSLRGSVPGSSLTGKSSHDLDDFIIKRDIHRVVVAQADEVRPDGSLTVGWLPTTKADVIGYQVYRAHDPAATTVTEPLTEDDLDRYQWTLINVNTDPEKRDQLEAQVTTSNQLRDTVPLPARGSYYYLVYLIKADTFASSQASADEETPYVEGGKVVLQWGQVNDPQLAGYRVYRAEVPAPSATATNAAQELRWDIIAQLIDGCEYTDVVDQSKVHYYQYKVSAISIWGVESAATVAAAPVRISTTIPPLVPTFLTPIAQPGQVQLRWKPVHDATRYTIYRSKVQIPKIKTVDLVAALRAAGVSGADQMNEEEALQWVEEKTASLSEVQKRAVLAEVKKRFGVLALAPYSALDRETAAEIQWVPINSQDISLADNELRANSGEVMIWTDNSVDYPHSYMYSIEAINEDRLSSGLSSPVTSGPLKAIGPSAPEPLTINIANNAVKLAWSAYTSHTPMGYLVFRASAEDGVYQQCSPLLATPEFSEPWNSVQSTWYRVVIIDEVGLMSAATKPVQASAMATNLPQGFDTPGPSGLDKGKGNLPGSLGLPLRGMAVLKPQAPLLSAGEITGTTVSLSWTAGSGIDQYEVYGYRTEQPEELMGTVDGKTSTYTVTGLKPSTQYYFYIKAKNRLGEAISNVGSAKTKSGSATPAPAVGNLTLTVTETTASSVKLAWTNTGSAPANYKVYCYKTEQPEQLLATLSGSSLAYTALSLTANTKYFFYVVAVGADGKPVVTSNVASAIAKPTAPLPTTPTTLPGTIRVAGYTIERVKEVPLVTMTNPNGTQIVGELVVPGLAPLAVKLSVQELRGDTLVK